MGKWELQYLADTLLIEKLAQYPYPLIKEADLFDYLGFDSVSNAIKEFVQDNIDPNNPIESLIDLLAPAVLWRIHPLLGISGTAAKDFGLGLTSIFNRAKSLVENALSDKSQLTPAEADSIAKNSVGISVSASLEPARELISLGQSKVQWKRVFKGIPLGYTKNAPLLKRIFGTLGSFRGKTLAAAILVWFIKTLLLASGLVIGAGLIGSMFSGDEEEKSVESPQSVEKPTEPKKQPKPKYKFRENVFEPSGRGQKYFPNNQNNIWVVPLLDGSIHTTLLEWAIDVYPELAAFEDLILNSRAFQETVNELKENYNRKTPGSLIMPKEFHTRKQVVDSFVEDIANQIGKYK